MDTILWRFNIFPGHEFCRLTQQDSAWHLAGMAALSYEGNPCQLGYEVVCDSAWHTLSASVEGWVGQTQINVQVRTDQDHRWWLNDEEQMDVIGCTDIDLNFSPSTNTIPIRRLNLAVGEAVKIRAAWLRFPSFKLEPLEQRYTRLEENIYRYESGGQFVVDLQVNQAGFVTDYPGIWQAESANR